MFILNAKLGFLGFKDLQLLLQIVDLDIDLIDLLPQICSHLGIMATQLIHLTFSIIIGRWPIYIFLGMSQGKPQSLFLNNNLLHHIPFLDGVHHILPFNYLSKDRVNTVKMGLG